MKTLFFILSTSFCISLNCYSQELAPQQKEKIATEVNILFERSVKAAENLDAQLMTESVDDSLKAGFISNGQYLESFDLVMKEFRQNIIGCKSQKMNILNKKITVLADNAVLITASGDYAVALEDDRTLTGTFAFTFVYSKINGNWKIIHSHM